MTPRNTTQDPPTSPAEAVTFALERFNWAAPDRLELAGTFDGLDASPSGAPVLVLAGASGTYRLTAAPGDVSGTPVNGELWSAAFVWHEAPAAFDEAMLELGDVLAVDLPAPSLDASPIALEARSAADAPPELLEPVAVPEELSAYAERLTLQEDLHLVQEQAHRLGEELARARADLDAEREARTEDAARYRAGLAEMRDAADAALREQSDGAASAAAEAEELREQLAAAQAEAADARNRLATAEAEAADARDRLATVEAEAADARNRLATAEAEAADARNRLATVREALQFPDPGSAEG